MSENINNINESEEFPEEWSALGSNREVVATGDSLMDVMVALKNAKKACKLKS